MNDKVEAYAVTRNRMSGQSWIHGMSQLAMGPTDPFPDGFTLSDTWGG